MQEISSIQSDGIILLPNERVLRNVLLLESSWSRFPPAAQIAVLFGLICFIIPGIFLFFYFLFRRRRLHSVTLVITSQRVIEVDKGWDNRDNYRLLETLSLSLNDIVSVETVVRWGLASQQFTIIFHSAQKPMLAVGAHRNFLMRILGSQEAMPAIDVQDLGEQVMTYVSKARELAFGVRRVGGVPGGASPGGEAPPETEKTRRELESYVAGIHRASRDQDWARVIALCQQTEQQFGLSPEVAKLYTQARSRLRVEELTRQLEDNLALQNACRVVELCDALLEEKPDSEDLRRIREENLPEKERIEARKRAREWIAIDDLEPARDLLQKHLEKHPEDDEAKTLAADLDEKIPQYIKDFTESLQSLLQDRQPVLAVEYIRSKPRWVATAAPVKPLCEAAVVLQEAYPLLKQNETAAAIPLLTRVVALAPDLNYPNEWLQQCKQSLSAKRGKYRGWVFGISGAGFIVGALLLTFAYYLLHSAELLMGAALLMAASLTLGISGHLASFSIRKTPFQLEPEKEEEKV